MRRLSLAFAAVVSATLLMNACSKFRHVKDESQKPGTVRDGELVVKFRDSAAADDVKKILAGYKKIEVIDAKNSIYLVKDASLKGEETEAGKELSENAAVEFAEPNFIVTAGAMPRDPYWMNLWGLKNYGQDAPNGIEGQEGADIGALEAWNTTMGDKNVVVAVIDTGIDYTHPDLAPNVWVNQKEKDGVPGVDDDGNGYTDDIHGWDAVSDHRDKLWYGQVGDPDPMDDMSHGTHVAGTIGAAGGNGLGIVGINWNVSIMGVKFLDANGSGASADEYRALQYVLANDVDVVNGSYGGGGYSRLIHFAIQKGLEKGILFVFAAGNNSANNDSEPNFPSNYPVDNIIAVAATDSRDRIADFSNFGQKTVHIAAPGVGILSTIPVALSEGKEPYAIFDGTSMASPHVAGAAALLIAADSSLRKNPVGIKERLMATVDFKPNLTAMTIAGGRLNIARAIANTKADNPLASGPWEIQQFQAATPEYAREKVDNEWPIHVPGAKAIRVHFKFAQIDGGFDVAMLYDGQYRPVMNITSLGDEWSPVILGDTARLKFSNAMVSINGGTPFANFNSAGVIIDQVEYIK